DPIPDGTVCVTGGIVDFETASHVAAVDTPMRVDAYDPLALLGNPNVAPLDENLVGAGCYTLALPLPPNHIVEVTLSNGPAPGTPALVTSAVATGMTPGEHYRIDVYRVHHATFDDWAAADGTI